MLNRVFGQHLQFLKTFVALLLLGVGVTAHAETPPSIGSISLVLGEARVQSASGERSPASLSQVIKVGDRIITGSNGHVHIRFVDKALVSVRPNSELVIERYEFNQAAPNQSAVKFSLSEGVVRSISGTAAKAARDRFRLNTPIAAIGVRGTDFIVSANRQTTQAQVEEGIIVLAPYSADCSSDALGPCIANAVALEGNSMQMLEMRDDLALPRLMPAQNSREVDVLRSEIRLASESASSRTLNDSVSLEGDSSDSNDVVLERTSQQLATNAETLAAAESNIMPATALAENDLMSRQLVWGRYSEGLPGQERITVDFDQARAERSIAVGNLSYGLYRPEEDSQHVNPGLGVISFTLDSAQAYYSSETGIVAMNVGGGNLDIDFNEHQFATQLNLSHALTGDVDFVASGRINDAGWFNSRTEDQRIGGAVSLDGREAGYFFEQQLESGGIQGLTLWDSQ